MDEIRMLHVLSETLQEAKRLVENHWHCNLGEFLKETYKETLHSNPDEKVIFRVKESKGILLFRLLALVLYCFPSQQR